MEILDATVIATAVPAMADSFGVEAVDVGIAISAYILTLAVLIPVSGWMADRFGVRRVFLAAIVVFTVASIGCALSPSLPVLVAMRVLQGVGGAMMVPVGRLAVLRATSKSELVRAIAYLTWPALTAPVLAPALGGAIVTYFSWRWIFLINVPLGIVGFLVGLRLVRGVDGTGPTRPLDWRGFVLTAVGIAALIVSLDSIRTEGTPWVAVGVGLAVAAVVSTAAVVHLRRAEHPLLDLTVLRVDTFRNTATYGSFYRMVITAVPFLLPLMFQLRFGWSPFVSGLMVIALFVGNIAIKPTTTPLMRRFGIRTVIIADGALSILCFGAIALVSVDTPPVVIAAILVISGALRSIGFTAYNSLAFADVDSDRLTHANTFNATAQELFSGFGIALGAIALTLSTAIVQSFDRPSGEAFSISFAALGVLMVVVVIGGLVLRKDAGRSVTAVAR
ncbi:drug resistance transporter, EmrB/QacA subfamily [Rhodococcoides kyotonense]|uniref:Drug resistance transporter, EmrB/QacA subfamily n=2 Tax=Rhodococcoides kyotonense TaxID=398843 RepID=A0A239MVE8_9NOCA|nr:MFS transporter [Rhodococcus kyotonensis]SNT46084.1 drug resistance transporter, EmrB/QacA subfamily [Rhodococcus kyotonensis]